MTSFLPGLCSVTFRHRDPAWIVSAAQDAQLSGIEWGGDRHVLPRDIDTARSVGGLTRAHDLLPISYGSYIDPPQSNLADFERARETAAAIGSDNIRIWPGTRGRPSADYAAHERTQAAATIRQMAQAASEIGLALSLEYHPDSLTDSTDDALRLIEDVAHDNAYLYWQPRPGVALAEAIAEIRRVGTHVSHLHVFAWDADCHRYPLADQEAYWREVVQAMPPSRYSRPRYALLEFVADDDPVRFQQDAATLRRLLGSPHPLWSLR